MERRKQQLNDQGTAEKDIFRVEALANAVLSASAASSISSSAKSDSFASFLSLTS